MVASALRYSIVTAVPSRGQEVLRAWHISLSRMQPFHYLNSEATLIEILSKLRQHMAILHQAH